MTEKDMQTLFGRHIKLHPPTQTEVYELKICKGTSLSFGDLKPHQQEALVNAEDNCLYHKITDQPWIKDRPWTYTLKKPFDCFILVEVKSFVVVWYYKSRKPKIFIKIPIKEFLKEQTISARKSLTEKRALEIGKPFMIKHE
jgi:hypothetical protein